MPNNKVRYVVCSCVRIYSTCVTLPHYSNSSLKSVKTRVFVVFLGGVLILQGWRKIKWIFHDEWKKNSVNAAFLLICRKKVLNKLQAREHVKWNYIQVVQKKTLPPSCYFYIDCIVKFCDCLWNITTAWLTAQPWLIKRTEMSFLHKSNLIQLINVLTMFWSIIFDEWESIYTYISQIK